MTSVAIATFAAGCFWGVELKFQRTPGVTGTRAGYIGGDKENPSYREVCADVTGHAEAVEVTYDPERVSYELLLDAFFEAHDPTQKNRQGPDVGSQYRSAIFVHSEAQRAAAAAKIAALTSAGRFARPIVTELVAAGRFWEAEEYHQKYLEKRGMGSCHL